MRLERGDEDASRGALPVGERLADRVLDRNQGRHGVLSVLLACFGGGPVLFFPLLNHHAEPITQADK